ncbi:hypothetical protein B0T18DRAFT_401272 [Schizothecium vesticola]|uniref:Uncharacterized protein n=1 Tax=Schizothecium vesticola TaxID=314040 RepID=A0AA40K9L8_9PEZI|nr:hypothetical protein B0T18DRAFT_401272 [Schizothecium vesticola]
MTLGPKAQQGTRAGRSITPMLACRMLCLAGDEGWVEAYAGNATAFFFSSQHPTPLPPPTSAPVNYSSHHITQCSSPSIAQIAIAPIKLPWEAHFHRPRGFGHPHLTSFQSPPNSQFPSHAPARSNIVDRYPVRIAPPFLHGHHGSRCLVVVFPTLQNAGPSPSKESWVVIGGPGAPAPSQQVLCAHQTTSIFTTRLDLVGSYPI